MIIINQLHYYIYKIYNENNDNKYKTLKDLAYLSYYTYEIMKKLEIVDKYYFAQEVCDAFLLLQDSHIAQDAKNLYWHGEVTTNVNIDISYDKDSFTAYDVEVRINNLNEVELLDSEPNYDESQYDFTNDIESDVRETDFWIDTSNVELDLSQDYQEPFVRPSEDIFIGAYQTQIEEGLNPSDLNLYVKDQMAAIDKAGYAKLGIEDVYAEEHRRIQIFLNDLLKYQIEKFKQVNKMK